MRTKMIFVNLLTLTRIIGTLILGFIYIKFGALTTAVVSLVCYLTDLLDGYLARKWKVSTFFGSLFDGLADKLFTIMNFIILYMITPYALTIIILEILILFIQFYKYRCNLNINLILSEN